MGKKLGKLKFKIYKNENPNIGVFDWSAKRDEIFQRFNAAEDIDEPETAFDELYEIIEDDSEFIDAYNGLGWWSIKLFNFGDAFVHFTSAFNIGIELIPEDFQGQIMWADIANRPFLKTLHGLGYAYLKMGRHEEADSIFEQLLNYNPNDNQGIRAVVVENKLIMGDYEGILDICDMFDDDTIPDILYGKVIALYRLGEKDKAKKSLKTAVKYSPNIIQELLKEEHNEIFNELPHMIQVGSELEAFQYWQRNRVIWTDPELLKFLKSSV